MTFSYQVTSCMAMCCYTDKGSRLFIRGNSHSTERSDKLVIQQL